MTTLFCNRIVAPLPLFSSQVHNEKVTRRTALTTLLAVAPINQALSGLALQGYDPVAYFTESRARKGLPAYSATHNSATYLFASAQNRDAFLAAPEKYVPQFGGYCAWAVAHGYTAAIDPVAWHIDNNKLHLLYNRTILSRWLKDKAKWIAEAERYWPT